MTFKPFLAALALIAVQASTHAAVTVGPCALYAGAGTGKAIASGATLDECAKAAKAAGTYTIKTPLTVAPDAVSIALTGLPDATTTARTASISYAASPASPVWCRLDSYAPIACPQPFVLGATPLAIGAHRVDFYAGATVPADLSKPTKSYSWVITAPPVVTPPVDPPPVVTSATALAVLPPVGWEGNGVDGYSGKSVIGSDGVPRLVVLRALDPWHATLQGVGPTGAVRVSAAELSALWGGEAWVPWRDFEPLPDVLQAGGSGRASLWLQQSLATLGFYTGALNGRFDAETQAAVRAFQRSRDLSEDGTVGPRTKMALYDSLGRYALPRLHTGREVG